MSTIDVQGIKAKKQRQSFYSISFLEQASNKALGQLTFHMHRLLESTKHRQDRLLHSVSHWTPPPSTSSEGIRGVAVCLSPWVTHTSCPLFPTTDTSTVFSPFLSCIEAWWVHGHKTRTQHVSFQQNTFCLGKYQLLEQLNCLKDRPASVLRRDA